jgi:tight adherence protein B
MPFQITNEHLSERARADLERLLFVNKSVGGPLAPVLQRFAQVLRKREELFQEIQIAATGPKASARLVMNLPLLVIIGGAISGIPVFRVIATSWVASASLAMGLLLYGVGNRWTNRILKRAEPDSLDPGFDLELLGIAVGAGLPVSSACRDFCIAHSQIEFLGRDLPTLQLLTERADELRLEAHNLSRKRINKASVAILWPLGLTVLPAFVLVAIVPLALALVSR